MAKKPGFIHLLSVTLVLLPFVSLELRSQEMSQEQKEVWGMEEQYWHYVQSRDVEGFSTLWHDGFRGWPATSQTVITKDSVTGWILTAKKNGYVMTSCLLHPKSVQLFDNVAIVLYAVSYVWKHNDGSLEGTGRWFKIIHSWMRVGKEWKIIGSLSATLPGNDEP